jgi:hypothetical protein
MLKSPPEAWRVRKADYRCTSQPDVTATQTPHWFPLECTPLTLICGEKISLGVAYLLLAKIVNVLRSAKMHEESLPHGASMLLSNNGRDFRSDGEPFAEADRAVASADDGAGENLVRMK